jgi:hypothetical protein
MARNSKLIHIKKRPLTYKGHFLRALVENINFKSAHKLFRLHDTSDNFHVFYKGNIIFKPEGNLFNCVRGRDAPGIIIWHFSFY